MRSWLPRGLRSALEAKTFALAYTILFCYYLMVSPALLSLPGENQFLLKSSKITVSSSLL